MYKYHSYPVDQFSEDIQFHMTSHVHFQISYQLCKSYYKDMQKNKKRNN